MPRASECYLMKQLKLNTLVIRAKTPIEKMPELIGKSYDAIFKYMEEIGEYACVTPFVMYHNMDMQNMDIEIGVPVSKKIEGKGEIKAGVIEEGIIAQTLHLGSYKDIEPTYDDLAKFIAEGQCPTVAKLKPTGIAIEWYYNDWTNVAEDKLVTVITMPLVKQ